MLGTSDQKSTKQISLIINKHGAVQYRNADGEQHQLRPGSVIRNSGSLELSKDASVVLYTAGNYLTLGAEGTHSLEKLVPARGMKKLNYDSRFSQYLMAAIDMVLQAKDGDGWGDLKTKGGGDGWGDLKTKGGGDGYGDLTTKGGGDGYGDGVPKTKGGGDGYGDLTTKGGGDGYGGLVTKGGGDGWGDEEGRSVPILPFGKIPAGPVIFQWSEPKVSKDYVLEILNGAGSIVHSTQVSDNWAQINLESLPLKIDETYAWRIEVPDDAESTSTKVRITIVDEKANDIISKRLRNSDAYQLNDPVLCGLMEAVVLEEKEHFYEAYERYEMLRQNNKENDLVKVMQAAFYVRNQLKPRARSLFS